MKTVKSIISVVVSLLVILLIVAFFLPSEYSISRSITINSATSPIYDHVVNYEKWNNWAPWPELDPQASHKFSGTMGEIGSSWAWEGEVLGSGMLTLENFNPNKSIRSKLIFKTPQEMESIDVWEFEAVSDGTKVTWISEGELGYPVGRLMGLFLEDMMAPNIEKGLKGLKREVESIAVN